MPRPNDAVRSPQARHRRTRRCRTGSQGVREEQAAPFRSRDGSWRSSESAAASPLRRQRGCARSSSTARCSAPRRSSSILAAARRARRGDAEQPAERRLTQRTRPCAPAGQAGAPSPSRLGAAPPLPGVDGRGAWVDRGRRGWLVAGVLGGAGRTGLIGLCSGCVWFRCGVGSGERGQDGGRAGCGDGEHPG